MSNFDDVSDLQISSPPILQRTISIAPFDVKTDEVKHDDEKKTLRVDLHTQPPETVERKQVQRIQADDEVEFHFDDDKEELSTTLDNLLIIADCDKPDLKIQNFEHMNEFSYALFQNIDIKTIFQKTKFLWLNLKHKEAREWLSKNLKHNPYNISIVYEKDKNDDWLVQINDFLAKKKQKPVIISLAKLKKIDGLNAEELLHNLFDLALKLKKPTSKAYKVLKFFCCGSEADKKKV